MKRGIMTMATLVALAIGLRGGTTSWEVDAVDMTRYYDEWMVNLTVIGAGSPVWLDVYLMQYDGHLPNGNYHTLLETLEGNQHPDLVNGCLDFLSYDLTLPRPVSWTGSFDSSALSTSFEKVFIVLAVRFDNPDPNVINAPFLDIYSVVPFLTLGGIPENPEPSMVVNFLLEVDADASVNSFALWGTMDFAVIPVPEPATGLLALAGVALLLRRKRT